MTKSKEADREPGPDSAFSHVCLSPEIAAAVSIKVTGDFSGEDIKQSVFRDRLVIKAAIILLAGSAVAGVMSILLDMDLVSVVTKDILIGVIYILSFAGALGLSGNLDAKRLGLLVANAALFQTWNSLFFDTRLAYFTFAIEMWLPVYWTLAHPSVMKNLGLSKKGFLLNIAAGLIISGFLATYVAWGMKNYGFDFTIDPSRIILNSGGLFTIYVSVFSLFFMVWNKLRSWGISRNGIILALAIMSVSINAPSFICVSMTSHTPPLTAVAGFLASATVMILMTNITFEKLRSPIPATILFTALQNLLLITGLT